MSDYVIQLSPVSVDNGKGPILQFPDGRSCKDVYEKFLSTGILTHKPSYSAFQIFAEF